MPIRFIHIILNYVVVNYIYSYRRYSEKVGHGLPLAIKSLIKQSIISAMVIFRHSLGDF